MVANSTQYTVTSSVRFQEPTVAWLSQFKAYFELEDKRLIVTRGYWAARLGIDYRTIKRWEDNIIKPTFELSYHYYDANKRAGRHGLDSYQRFFLFLIRSMKLGLSPYSKCMTYEEIISYFKEVESGMPLWMGVTRDEFNSMYNVHSKKAG